MSELQQALEDINNVGWEELKSDKDQEYRVKASDYNIADKPTGEGEHSVAASGPSFKDVFVYWIVDTSGAPSTDIQNKTAITWYKLERTNRFSVFQYRLSIKCSDTYDYKFTDQSPDTYTLDVWQNAGTHILEYRSSEPTIRSISGS